MTADETPTPPLDPYEYPNLRAILDGRVAGDWTEWPMVRVELRKIQQALARAQEHDCRELSICEIGAANPSVLEYMRHWEARAERAEAELAKANDAATRWYEAASPYATPEALCAALASAPSAKEGQTGEQSGEGK